MRDAEDDGNRRKAHPHSCHPLMLPGRSWNAVPMTCMTSSPSFAGRRSKLNHTFRRVVTNPAWFKAKAQTYWRPI